MTKEQRREYNKKWREKHPAYYKNYSSKYYYEHLEYFREQWKKWIGKKENLEHKRAYDKKYKKEHYEKFRRENRKYIRKYKQSPKGKVAKKKENSKRKQFGFIPLNEYLEGCEGHHIDKERVIYIPKEIHRSVWHSLSLGIGMDKINRLAFQYLKMKNKAKNKSFKTLAKFLKLHRSNREY